MSIIMKYNRRKEAGKPKMWKITQDATIKVPSGIRSMDVFLVGGGGAGVMLESTHYLVWEGTHGYLLKKGSNQGGCGGWVKTKRNIEIEPNQELIIKVGAGGKALRNGKNNENRSFFLNDRYHKVYSSFQYDTGSYGKGQSTYIGPRDGWTNYNVGCVLCNGENSYIKSNGSIIAEAKGGGGFIFSDESLNYRKNYYYKKISPISGSNYGGYNLSGIEISGGSIFSNFSYNGESNGGLNKTPLYSGRTKITKYGLHYFYYVFANNVNLLELSWPFDHSLSINENLNNTYDNLLLDNKSFNTSLYNSGKYTNYISNIGLKYPVFNLKSLSVIATDAPPNTKLFEEEDGPLFAGGGGAGRIRNDDGTIIAEAGVGGDGGGGDGAKGTNGKNGEPNTGGGGGGAQYNNGPSNLSGYGSQQIIEYPAGDGGSGVVYIRFYPNERRDIQVDWDSNPVII